MLPRGKKSLAEIAELPGPDDRVCALVTLLEYLLLEISPELRQSGYPNGDDKKLYRLVERHKNKFSNFGAVDYARKVRNRLGHAEGNPTDTQIMRAEIDLERSVREILPYCSETLQADALGEVKAPPPPNPFVPPPEPDPPPRPQRAAPTTISAPPPPPPPQGWLAHPKFWFLLAAATLFLAGVTYLVQPRTQQAQTDGPSGGSHPGFSEPPPPAVKTTIKDPAVDPTSDNRESQFRNLINRNLSISAAQPSLAVLIDSSGPSTPGSIADSMSGFLAGSNIRIINNFADINALKTQGFFADLYGGNSKFLILAAQLSHVDYILLGTATYSFRRQAELDPDLTTCDLSLTARLANRAGTVVQSDSFTVTGPGFTHAQALERASENAGQRLKEKILDAIQ